MADVGTRQFNGVLLGGQSRGAGSLKLSTAGLSWKARDTSRTVEISPSDLTALEWLRGGKGQQLRCSMRGGTNVKFDGFRENDFASIGEYVEQAGWTQKLTRAQQSSAGWNWGESKVIDSSLVMRTGKDKNYKEEIFDVALAEVSQVNMPSKKEVSMEFHVDDTADQNDEMLVEIRIAIPDEDDATDLFNKVKAKADTSAFAGDSIASFDSLPILVPRGRYDVDLYPNHLKLHGKSVDYKILYSSVTRLFLLPKPDEQHVAFVISLDPPIRQGNTMYPHMVFQFSTDATTTVDIKLTPEELKTKYKDKLQQSEHAEVWRVFSKVVRSITGRPLHVPKTFQSKDNQRAVRTSLGANEGYLFFLESSFFFVNKPPTYVRFDDVDVVEFKRMDLERRFDLSLTTLSGQTYLFSNVDRQEFELIYKFLQSKDVTMEGGEQALQSRKTNVVEIDEDDDESEDDDFMPQAKKGKRDEDDSADDVDDDELDDAYEAEAASEDDVPKAKKRK